MAKEIERKFLVEDYPFMKGDGLFIEQGYIFIEGDKHLRIRRTEDRTFLCLKYTKELVRDEYEYEIPSDDGVEILKKCDLVVEKTRHAIPVEKDDLDVILDIYPHGLMVAEIEFKTKESSDNFEPFFWLGKEITGDYDFSNITLAKQNLRF